MRYCSYDDGMFSDETYVTHSIFDTLFEFQAACFHEAGHAVVGYLLGEGCTAVSVSVRYQTGPSGELLGKAYGGIATESRSAIKRVNSHLHSGIYTPTLARHGIATAAGPASERRFRFENEMPLRLFLGAKADHERIDMIALRLEQGSRSRIAFRRLVWRVAQRLLETAVVWDCVAVLAYELSDSADLSEDSDDTFVLPGARARAIMNRGGCNPNKLKCIMKDC